ncbi:MAG: SMC-Scp complex subunit ScpB [Eubacteriales bacterium]|nr:SMC-Scp complex subunit ScpB [Eubacteriales bacterium]
MTAVAAIEAILFAMGEAVEISALCRALSMTEGAVRKGVAALQKRYESSKCGLQVTRLETAVQLTTKPSLYPYLIRIASAPKKYALSDTLLETLSIVAYKQPITRAEIESIRGVNSDFAVNKLVSYDLIRELGRKDAPGRPLLFGTTEQFLRSFGVGSIEELPSLSAVQVEEFKEEAEKEVETRMNV